MNPRIPRHFLTFGLVSAVVARSSGAVFDLRTTVSGDSDTIANRLFLDAGFTLAAPSSIGGAVDTGTTLWIVADTGNNGLPFALNQSGLIQATGILGADDEIIFNTEVDGTIVGNQAGRYQRIGVNVDDRYNSATVPVFAFLWNPTSPGGVGRPDNLAAVNEGMKFGVRQVGVTLDTIDPGNGKWRIFENINASQLEIAPVPEPKEMTLLLSGLLAALSTFRLLWTRRPTRSSQQ